MEKLTEKIDDISAYRLFGRVTKILGMMVEIGGIEKELSIGGLCILKPRGAEPVPCEVVGFRDGKVMLMAFGNLQRVGLGCRAEVGAAQIHAYPSEAWLGRVINAFAAPLDNKGPLPEGDTGIPLRNSPPPAHSRKRLGPKLDLGIRAINTCLSTCQGQRMGIFSGSGVGKSVLMSMLARYGGADVNVIGLVGERGREVQEFLKDELLSG